MLSKLIIYRQAKIKSDTMASSSLAALISGEVLEISPSAWAMEAGLSHYGFILGGLKLKQLDLLKQFEQEHPDATVLDLYTYGKDNKIVPRSVEDTLKTIGLRINTLAAE